MRTLGILVAAGAIAAIAPQAAKAAMPVGGLDPAIADSNLVEQTQLYVYGGRRYCFYFNGWHGPGWYRCGFAFRRGLGWGGVYGWRGWNYGPYERRFGGRRFDGGSRYGGRMYERGGVRGERFDRGGVRGGATVQGGRSFQGGATTGRGPMGGDRGGIRGGDGGGATMGGEGGGRGGAAIGGGSARGAGGGTPMGGRGGDGGGGRDR
jgi:hypothetical protein